jgi:hypothetical protein
MCHGYFPPAAVLDLFSTQALFQALFLTLSRPLLFPIWLAFFNFCLKGTL